MAHYCQSARHFKKWSLFTLFVFPFIDVVQIADAAEYRSGKFKASIDTTISAGVSLRVEEQSDELAGTSKGNDNFDKDDLVALPFKGSNDIEINYGNVGAFVRFTYLYDPKIEGKDDDEIPPEAKSRLGHDLRLLDAFIFGSTSIMGKSLDARLGNQVLSWGESTFISGGLNTINPVDVGRILIPGAEIKEALLPVPIFQLSFPDILPYTGVEFFYQIKWDETEPPPVGTFFSFTDLLGEGNGGSFTIPGLEALGSVPPGSNVYPDDGGQFGIHFSFTIPQLDYTEIGLYFINYHSQTPVLGGTPITALLIPPPPVLPDLSTASYFWEYPENIRVYGLSANGQVGDTALQGEISYRPNLAIGIAQEELLAALLTGQTIKSYQRYGVYQAQTTATRVFNHFALGSDSLTLVGELAYTWLEGDPGGEHFDQDAFGFSVTALIDYFDVVPGITLTPGFSMTWHVDGTLGPFTENSKQARASVEASYVDTWSVDLSYSGYFGENIYADRDIISLVGKYSF